MRSLVVNSNRHQIRLACLLLGWSCLTLAQEMQPRAYLPAPVGVGFAGISYAHNSGGLLFDPSLPVEDAHVKAHIPSLSLGMSFGTLGRSSQALVVLPYVVADLNGRVAGVEEYRYRSGLADMTFRYAINLHGAPAMTRKEFASYQQKTIVGVSVTAVGPTGQYDPALVINIGTNRWAVKPEVGVSRRLGKWTLEGALGAWLYTRNTRFLGDSIRTQDPLWSVQAHLVRTIRRRHWVAFDATYFAGGQADVDGEKTDTYQSNSRLGATYGIALTRRQAIRFSYFEGVTTRVGTDIRTFGVAYQFIWAGGR